MKIFQIYFMNGKAIAFYADDVEELANEYVFLLDGVIVAQFDKKNIAGYVIAGADDDENE